MRLIVKHPRMVPCKWKEPGSILSLLEVRVVQVTALAMLMIVVVAKAMSREAMPREAVPWEAVMEVPRVVVTTMLLCVVTVTLMRTQCGRLASPRSACA